MALRDISDTNPGWTLKQLVAEIDQLASNERQLAGTLGDDTTLEPEKHLGEVVVATMHKAKGLEWDRVYLTALNNYDFPSGGELDTYKSEYWFVRDGLNLQAEALGQLDSLIPDGPAYQEGVASQEARDDYVRERLRLLYVGITRAKRDLIATWNTGRKRTQTPATPNVAALYGLHASLQKMMAEGLETIVARHQRIGDYCRAGILALGLGLFADPAHYSNTVTAVSLPPVALTALRSIGSTAGRQKFSGASLVSFARKEPCCPSTSRCRSPGAR